MALIDLTGINTVYFDIYSSRTGSNLKIGIHDSGGATTETTPNITSANAWQTVNLDLSAVSDANKNAIDKITVTILNADVDNTFYIDNMKAGAGEGGDEGGEAVPEFTIITAIIAAVAGFGIYFVIRNKKQKTTK